MTDEEAIARLKYLSAECESNYRLWSDASKKQGEISGFALFHDSKYDLPPAYSQAVKDLIMQEITLMGGFVKKEKKWWEFWK